MSIQKPNCGNCSLYDDCPLSCIVISKVSQQQLIVDTVGCLIHPGAREWLMALVIKELEQLYNEETTHSSSYSEGKADGYDRAISLIRGDGK